MNQLRGEIHRIDKDTKELKALKPILRILLEDSGRLVDNGCLTCYAR
jgi:hypothetical protein